MAKRKDSRKRTPKPVLKSYEELMLERQRRIEEETEKAIRDLHLDAKTLLGGLLAEAKGEIEVEKPSGIPGMTSVMPDTSPAARNAAWIALGKVLGIPGLNDAKATTVKASQKADGTQEVTVVVRAPATEPEADG